MIHVMVLHCYLFQNIRRPQPAITNRYIDYLLARSLCLTKKIRLKTNRLSERVCTVSPVP